MSATDYLWLVFIYLPSAFFMDFVVFAMFLWVWKMWKAKRRRAVT